MTADFLRCRLSSELESLEASASLLRSGAKEAPAEAIEGMLNVCHNCLQRAVDLHSEIERAEQ